MSSDRNGLRLSDISLICLARMLARNLWMIVAAALILGMSTSLYLTWFHKPVYRATMTYAVTARRTTYGGNNNISASREVAAVMTQLLETNVIRDSIRESSPELANFSGTIKATQVDETNMITVNVEDSSPEQAFRALNALVDRFPELSDYISQSNMPQIIRYPTVSSTPTNQVNSRKMTMTAAAAGALLMAALLCWIGVSRETVQTRSGARHLLDAPIVATVSHEQKNRTLKARLLRSGKGLQVFAPTTSYNYTEQINAICTRLEQENTARGLKIFLVTGVGENEGKSTIAGNVAALLAMKGKSVALVDADLRKPAMNRFFDGAYKAALPLNRMLAKPYSREDLLDCMVRHSRLNLYMLFPAGPDKRSADLLTGNTMQMLLKQLRVFDYVIIDTPPMGFFADTELLAEMVDASLLVVRQDRTPACDINDAVDTLRGAKSTFLGCVLNDMAGHSLAGYGYYGYGKAYGYGSAGKSGQKSS